MYIELQKLQLRNETKRNSQFLDFHHQEDFDSSSIIPHFNNQLLALFLMHVMMGVMRNVKNVRASSIMDSLIRVHLL